ncbi:MAG TPA: cell wall hydrolase [Sphingomicrobium sp.]|nr:cell wall hydrolase [Sphingomicrobium sp.]
MGFLLVAFGSSEAGAQDLSSLNVPAAVRSLDVSASARPLGIAAATTAATSSVAAALPAASVSASLAKSIDREAAWLYKGGWPLYALADRYATGAALSDEANCIATAVYFEARGESLEGQLAVARVVMNRAASGQYPVSWCAVVKQPAQFSFVRHGAFPAVNTASAAWARAQGITRLAMANVVPSLTTDVLWYHANYVAPSWGKRLSMAQKIGAHIFYR